MDENDVGGRLVSSVPDKPLTLYLLRRAAQKLASLASCWLTASQSVLQPEVERTQPCSLA